MRTLLLGADTAVGSALQLLPLHADLGLQPVPAGQVELLRIRRLARLLRRYRPDYVISLLQPHRTAADSATSERISRLCDEGFRNLASLCQARESVLIHLSSDAVFVGSRDGMFAEEDRPEPANDIAARCLAGEDAVRAAGGRHHILRTGWVFSDHPGNELQALCEQLEAGASRIDAGPSWPLYPVSAADVARVLATMVVQSEYGCQDWGYYHYSSGEAVAWPEFVREVASLYRHLLGHPEVTVGEAVLEDGLPCPPVGALLGCRRILGVFGVRQRDWRRELEHCLAARFRVAGAGPVPAPENAALEEGG